ncbi:MAG: zf-HC2 domain-containing protein [Anaerolineae bacterium]
MSEPLTCQELVELVTEYLEGALPPPARMRFEDHLRLCEGCTQYVEQMRTTINLTGHLSEESIEPQAKADLLNVFRQWKADR